MSTESKINFNETLKKLCTNIKELESMATDFGNQFTEVVKQPTTSQNGIDQIDNCLTYSHANISLFYLYLILKDHQIDETVKEQVMEEISRVRGYHQAAYILKNTPRKKLNIRATRNVIKNALWDVESGSQKRNSADSN